MAAAGPMQLARTSRFAVVVHGVRGTKKRARGGPCSGRVRKEEGGGGTAAVT